MANNLKMIQLSEIQPNKVALRQVNKSSEEYAGLVDSIRQRGILNPISVRARKDEETGTNYYELVDGLHRFNAAKDAGLVEIPVHIVSLDDDQVLEAQVIANIQRVETKPKEYSEQLKRILSRNATLTIVELAAKLGKSTAWLNQRLSLNHIEDAEIGSLIDEGKIGLTNAYNLAKLPPDEQRNWVDRAIAEDPATFVPAVTARVKEIHDARRQGKKEAPVEFQPVAYMQKMKDIKETLDNPEAVKQLCLTNDAKSLDAVIKMTLSWVLHLDPENVAMQKAKDDERKKKRAEAKQKKIEERQKKLDEEAATVAADLGN